MKIAIENDHASANTLRVIPLLDSDQLPDLLGRVSDEMGLGHLTNFEGKSKESLWLYPSNNEDEGIVLLVGIGHQLIFKKLSESIRSVIFKNRKWLSGQVALDFTLLEDDVNKRELPTIWEALTHGFCLAGYDIGLYKAPVEESGEFFKSNTELRLKSGHPEQIREAAEKGRITADTQSRILDLVNAPSNKLLPGQMADWAVESGKQFGYQVTTYTKQEMVDMGLHALLAVNQGSAVPPAFIVMQYQGANAQKHVGLVGKGVTFDTGGLSIKPSNNMHFMKSDMGGAAAVLGIVELTARLQLPVQLTAIVPSTENTVDALSVKPGDVIDSYAGKTIEVIDTDAEGRLILADGLAYMVKHFKPEIMIDLATLTGSCVRTLGYLAAGLMTKNDQVAEALVAAGERTGERLWRLPMWDEYGEDMKSDVADIKNLSAKPLAGATTAGKFLEAFTEEHPQWAHLDIAGVAFGDSEYAAMKSGTGYGIKLITDYLANLES